LNDQRRVLIVDSCEETCEVLKTVLERHGVTVSSDRLSADWTIAGRDRPDVIVLDIESVDAASCRWLTPLAESSETEHPRLLVLGTFRRQGEAFPKGEFVAKPYQYGALIRKIEELIGESGPCPHCSSSAGPTKEPASS
jgi:DNA-binding NtrC family response regulator